MKKKHNPMKPFLVFGKFENVAGGFTIETWAGRARSMPVALRRAVLAFWQRKDVRWRHHALACVTAMTLTENEYLQREKKGASHG